MFSVYVFSLLFALSNILRDWFITEIISDVHAVYHEFVSF